MMKIKMEVNGEKYPVKIGKMFRKLSLNVMMMIGKEAKGDQTNIIRRERVNLMWEENRGKIYHNEAKKTPEDKTEMMRRVKVVILNMPMKRKEMKEDSGERR